MGKKKNKQNSAAASSAAIDDDALLDAAIKESKEAKEAATLAEMEAQADSSRKAAAAVVSKPLPTGLTPQQVVEKLNDIPTFAVMHETPKGRKFVPLHFKEDAEDKGLSSCAFFAEPYEAKHALLQAKKQHPDMNLAIGVMPLGKAYALAVGWAEAGSQKVPFTLRAEPKMAKQLRPLLKQQLEVAKLPTHWHFPVFMCEEIQSATVLPVFLTREGLASTWKALGKEGPPPTQVTVTDLRIVVEEMQKGFKETGCDWSIVRFLGSEQGWNAVKEGMEQQEATAKAGAGASSEQHVADRPMDPADVEAEPPPLF